MGVADGNSRLGERPNGCLGVCRGSWGRVVTMIVCVCLFDLFFSCSKQVDLLVLATDVLQQGHSNTKHVVEYGMCRKIN